MKSEQTDLLLVRHGATTWSQEDRFCGRSDIPLADEGLAQAQQLAQRLSSLPIQAVYSSPLVRAAETARILAAPHGLRVTTIGPLREIDFGAWEGQPRALVKAEASALYTAWERDPLGTAPPNGEAAEHVADRAIDAVTIIGQRHVGQCILVVAHKTVNRLLLCHWLGLPLNKYRDRVAQSPCALNWVELQGDRRPNGLIMRLNDDGALRFP